MTDHIVFFQRKDHVREKSQHVLGVTFRDRATALNVTPTNIRYRIDDLTNCRAILDWTTVSPDDEITLTITPTQNELLCQGNREEKRQVTVAADYGLSGQYMDSVCFDVENLRGVS
jgi:hypothetical protein